MLNLKISASQIQQLAAVIIADQVTGFIYLLRIPWVQRVLDKSSIRFVRISIISASYKRASDTQFADFSRCRFRTILTKDDQVTVVAGTSNRQCFTIRKIPVHNVIGTDICYFCRPIQIGIQQLRHFSPPVIQLFHRHHLTGEKNLLHIRKGHIIQHFPISHYGQSRRHPVNGIHFSTVHILQQTHRKSK